MAFLDYLLGGVSGGFEGYERKKARELQAQKDEEERQFRKLTLLNQFDFQPTGLVDQGAAPGARNTVADISANLPKPISDTKLGSAFEAARQRGFGIEPSPASPLTSPVSLALDTAKGRQPEQPPRMPQTGPEIQVNTPFGRMGFTRKTEEQKRADKLAEMRQAKDLDLEYADKTITNERNRMREVYAAAYPNATTQQVEAMAGGVKPETIGLEILTPSQKRAEARQRRLDDLEERYKNAQITNLLRKDESQTTGTGPIDFTNDLQIIQDFLPTIGPDGKVSKPKRQLSGQKSLAVQQGGPSGTFLGQVANLALTTYGADLTNEQLYNTIAEGIATAYAIQEQRGRNVSDRDINNRIAQIKVLPNEVGSLEVQQLKGQRLQQWANRLMQGNIPQIQPGQTYKIPVGFQAQNKEAGVDAMTQKSSKKNPYR